MQDFAPLDFSRIAQDLQVRKTQIESAIQLLDEGNTIPFITRYRKERTGGLHEEVLRQIQARVAYHRKLNERKQTILKSIEGQGKLTDELRGAIVAADTSKRLEDLYLPYKPKKRSPASTARDMGLEALALAIWNRDPAIAGLADSWTSFVNPEKGLTTPEDVQLGVGHILAEMMAETAAVRAVVRSILWETGKICSTKSEKLPEGRGLEYREYFEFSEQLRQIPPYRILAINRGEKDTALKTALDFPADHIRAAATKALADCLLASTPLEPSASAPELGEQLSPESAYQSPHAEFLRIALEDGLGRLVLPSLEREIRRELTDEAEAHAVMVLRRNLRSMLLQPPLAGRRVVAIHPGFRSGCKVVAVDELGVYLEDATIYPHAPREREKKPHKEKLAAAQSPPSPGSASGPAAPPPDGAMTLPVVVSFFTASAPPEPAGSPETQAPAQITGTESAAAPAARSKRDEAKAKLADLITRNNITVVALGNGAACRETEEFITDLIRERLPELSYAIVNEAGAGAYAASNVGREELPHLDAAVRGAMSIGRRLQDPLSELVKIEPHNIGVGLHQHDISPRHLKGSLEGIMESCVNHVGVDLNTAGVPQLRHISGLNPLTARDIVEFRKAHGSFSNREQLLQVPNLGPARFVQAAGFLRIPQGDNPLDRTWVHPESYGVAARLLAELGYGPESLLDPARQEELRQKLRGVRVEETAIRLQVGVPTLRDMLDCLARPGQDVRDELPPPALKKSILRWEDLQPGLELRGTVLNVVDFGAFVDIGLKDCGLVHISQIANRYIKCAYDVIAVGDAVDVWVLNVDQQRRRVSLTMIKPGMERKPEPRRPPMAKTGPPAGDGGDRQQRPQQGRQGGRQDQRGPRGPGRSGGPPPRRGQSPRPQAPAASTGSAATGASTAEAGTNRQGKGPPPRKSRRREPPRPKLSQDALEGKTPLRTFAELGALFAAKQTPPPTPVSPAHPPADATPSQNVAADLPAIIQNGADVAASEQPQPSEIPPAQAASPPP